jgi:uncharacterized protein
MEINILKIIDGTVDNIDFNLKLDIKQIEFNSELINIVSPIEFDGQIKYSQKDMYELQGTIKAYIMLQCARCLVDHQHHLTSQVNLILVRKKHEGEEFPEDSILIDGDTVEMEDIIIENFLLSVPIKVLCQEDCKGLCPVCGINRNTEKCTCQEQKIDPRFAALKDLLDNNKEV